jgi:hypothetical protein
MLFREIIAVYCENHTEHINTLCGQNAEFLNVQAGCIYGYHKAQDFGSLYMKFDTVIFKVLVKEENAVVLSGAYVA